MLGPNVHVAYWPCELYLEFGCQICLVIYAKYVYSAPCFMVDGSAFMYGIHVCIHPLYTCQAFAICGIYVQLGGSMCFWDIFGNNM